MVDSSDKVIVAWGDNKVAQVPAMRLHTICEEAGIRMWCLGTTVRGMPKHPLYARADTELKEWGNE